MEFLRARNNCSRSQCSTFLDPRGHCEVLSALITEPKKATTSTWRTRSQATTTHVTLAYARLIRAQSLGDTKYTTRHIGRRAWAWPRPQNWFDVMLASCTSAECSLETKLSNENVKRLRSFAEFFYLIKPTSLKFFCYQVS